MVNDFLRKYQKELITDKIQLKEDIDFLETKIKEESKFLELLESSNDSYFQEFTPRIINKKNNEKADEVRKSLSGLEERMKSKTEKMKFYDSRISELSSLLSSSSSDNYNVSSYNNIEENYSDTYDLDSIKTSLCKLKELIILDPYRASIELDSIISKL